MRRLRLCLALLLAACGLSGCAVDGSLVGRPGAPAAAKLLADARAAFGSQGSIRVLARERARDGQVSTTVTSLQFRGLDIVSRQSDGIEADVRVLDGSAWSRGNPLYWVSSQGLESLQVPRASRGWDAMRPAELHLPAWFVHALGDAALLERCEVPSLPGGTLSVTGHETIDGHASTVLTDRASRGPARERIVVESGPPYLPERITRTGGVPADPACGVSAAAARAVGTESLAFEDANAVTLARPHASLDQVQYAALLAAPSATSAQIPVGIARALAGRHTMNGRVAATLGVRGDRVGERMSLPWTITPHCAGDQCHLLLSIGDGRGVPLRGGRDGLFADLSVENRCAGGVRRAIPTRIGLVLRHGHLSAWSTEATTACGGPSADYLVWQGR